MSANSHNNNDHHDHHDDEDEIHVSMCDYAIGFVLAVILTVIPFALVMGGVIQSSTTTALVILALGAVQMVVHMVYFLHMNSKSEGGWNMLGLMFTLIIVVITLVGSIWVMHHLNKNMMPSMNHEAIESIQQLK
ncbi:MAG: cytochrome o ubiquinol oxidase subunit IV [Burkholderiales bacterium]|jgi:cytochrome o ubiquinol oxidase operon protein cyoD|uniref:cytochrome o ubiquinol oxidase subunit IV n=1 Tax=Limnobacter sp. TaxID=2003368 RepID=UPI0039368628|nr:cytochrome o ubiquinol oxidase subunit IV [Burkholderiales bacterium]